MLKIHHIFLITSLELLLTPKLNCTPFRHIFVTKHTVLKLFNVAYYLRHKMRVPNRVTSYLLSP